MFRGWKPQCELQLISRPGRSLCVTLRTTAHSVGQQTAGSAALKGESSHASCGRDQGSRQCSRPAMKEARRSRGGSLIWMDCWSLKGTLYATHSSQLILFYISQFVRGRLCQNRRVSADTCKWHLLSYFILQKRKEVQLPLKSNFFLPLYRVWFIKTVTQTVVFMRINERKSYLILSTSQGKTLLCWPISVGYITLKGVFLFGLKRASVFFLAKISNRTITEIF